MNAFWRMVLCLGLVGCKHIPTEKEQQGAQIHYDLGIQAQQGGDVQSAFKEFDRALTLDPRLAEAHNAMGILLHLSFQRIEEAVEHYQEALKIRPTFSEVKTNLANAYLDLRRYDQAVALYAEALNDMLYSTPFIAQGNMGWALYKKGEVQRGIQQIKAAVTVNPKFCLGYRNLGIIQDEQGNLEEACRQFGRYRENCPEVADAYFREGVCLARMGQREAAREKLATCQSKASTPALKDDCRLYAEKLQ